MGDMLLTTPMIRDLKSAYPKVSIDVVAEELPAQVIRDNPHIRKIFTVPPRGSGIREYFPVVRLLRSRQYRLSIDIISTPGSALLSRLIGARFRVGYRLRGRTWAYTHPVDRCTENIYNPLTKYHLLSGSGVKPSTCYPELFLNEKDEEWAVNTVSDCKLEKPDTLIAFAPWSKRAWRRWDFELWLEVMKRVSQNRRILWLLFASRGEREQLCAIENAEGIFVHWVGADNIHQAAALIRKCCLMLGADNGLKHISVAVGTPTITIFNGSDPIAWNPPGDPRHIALDFHNSDDSSGAVKTVVETVTTSIEKKSSGKPHLQD